MADRIFPNRFQEDPLDSDLVFQGIDWDNFNQRLAEAKDDKGNKVPVELMEALHDANEEAFVPPKTLNSRYSWGENYHSSC